MTALMTIITTDSIHIDTLDDLAAQVPYLARLGVSHVYLSPIYAARPESPHGYDIDRKVEIIADRGIDAEYLQQSQ